MKKLLTLLSVILILSCGGINTNTQDDPVDHSVNMMLWLESIQMDNGLLPTYEYSYYNNTIYGSEVSLYDNALATIAFVMNNDFQRAELILDFFNSSDEEVFSQFRYPTNGVPSTDALWMGDNAWLLIAIKNYHYYADNTNYSEMETRLEEWIISLQDDDGGLFAGYNADGNLQTYKVIEGNIDAYNGVSPQGDFHDKLLNYLNSQWDAEKELFEAWPNSQWLYAMDTTPWGYCALPNMPDSMLEAADRYLVTEDSTGYCFDDDLDVIWFEGTGQMVVAYNKQGNEDKANFYLTELEKEIVYSPINPELYGLPYCSNNTSTHYANGALWEASDKAPHISSTVWYIFGKRGFNPFIAGQN